RLLRVNSLLIVRPSFVKVRDEAGLWPDPVEEDPALPVPKSHRCARNLPAAGPRATFSAGGRNAERIAAGAASLSDGPGRGPVSPAGAARRPFRFRKDRGAPRASGADRL